MSLFKTYNVLLAVCGILLITGCERPGLAKPEQSAKVVISESNFSEAINAHGWDKLYQLAEDGNCKAQYFIAYAYQAGEGVAKNFAEARKWLRRCANQGSPEAQFRMGILVLEDMRSANLMEAESIFANAYMWFNLAAARGQEEAKAKLLFLEKNPSSGMVSAIKKGQALSAAWHLCEEKACWDYEPPVERIKLSFEK